MHMRFIAICPGIHSVDAHASCSTLARRATSFGCVDGAGERVFLPLGDMATMS